MKKGNENMKARNGVKKTGEKVRATISIDDDCHPDHSEKVAVRMKERRARNFSHLVEILIAEDAGLIAKLQEAGA